MDHNSIPDSATKYILLQRTGYLPRVNKIIKGIDKLSPVPIHENLMGIISRINSNYVKKLFVDDMRKEFYSIEDYLPENCCSILDIGCGVAGIDVFLADYYDQTNLKIYLLDKTKTENSIWYGFHSEGAFYNSLVVAKKLLTNNGIPSNRITSLEVNKQNEINIDQKIDLIISLISWGFHYPVNTYVEKVYQLLNKNGVVILDIRNKTNGLDLMKEYFPTIHCIFNSTSFTRIAATKG